jgi:hypothetical protein
VPTGDQAPAEGISILSMNKADAIRCGRISVADGAAARYVKQLEDQVTALTHRVDELSHGSGSLPTQVLLPLSIARQTTGCEVSGVNKYTRNVEFYGGSSSVALLVQVQSNFTAPGSRESPEPRHATDACSIVSTLHNPDISPTAVPSPVLGSPSIPDRSSAATAAYHPQCRVFVRNFFSSLHYIHPILDKHVFLSRCEDLWAANAGEVTGRSFLALYYAILSLGALVGERDDEPIGGIENAHWSRIFFEAAEDLASRLGSTTNLDMVHCYFFMVRQGEQPGGPPLLLTGCSQAKVCQNRLNAHRRLVSVVAFTILSNAMLGSYILVGLAVRTALAMGINRRAPPSAGKDDETLRAESRTWW